MSEWAQGILLKENGETLEGKRSRPCYFYGSRERYTESWFKQIFSVFSKLWVQPVRCYEFFPIYKELQCALSVIYTSLFWICTWFWNILVVRKRRLNVAFLYSIHLDLTQQRLNEINPEFVLCNIHKYQVIIQSIWFKRTLLFFSSVRNMSKIHITYR